MTLQATDIRHAIGPKTILDGIDLTAHPGEVTAIVGPNGSGKTTLLRVLTGEDRAQGTVTLNGIPVTPSNAPRLAAMRGVLPQASRIAFPFKVAEVVRIGLHSGPHGRDSAIADRALAAVDLSGFADRFYQELSGGEQQRVQLARVLAQVWQPSYHAGPCWLFLDEPVASLDIGHQLGIMQLARDYAQRGGGVVTVMHDLNLTAMFADRIAVMKSGRITAHGTPDQVLTDAVLSDAYACRLRTSTPPPAPMRYVLPQSAGQAS